MLKQITNIPRFEHKDGAINVPSVFFDGWPGWVVIVEAISANKTIFNNLLLGFDLGGIHPNSDH